MSASAELQARTAQAHERVDAAFSAFDLSDPTQYAAFLLAHSRALPAAEALIRDNVALPPARPRTRLLQEDLEALEQTMPAPLALDCGTDAATAWGIFYVVEGSRLGGSILAERVGAHLPTAYLGARHRPGEWKAIRQAIDAEALQHDAAWIDRAVTGAQACFELYEQGCGSSSSI